MKNDFALLVDLLKSHKGLKQSEICVILGFAPEDVHQIKNRKGGRQKFTVDEIDKLKFELGFDPFVANSDAGEGPAGDIKLVPSNEEFDLRDNIEALYFELDSKIQIKQMEIKQAQTIIETLQRKKQEILSKYGIGT